MRQSDGGLELSLQDKKSINETTFRFGKELWKYVKNKYGSIS